MQVDATGKERYGRIGRLVRRCSRWTTPEGYAGNRGLRYWQERVLLTILLSGIVTGMFAYIPSMWLSVREGIWSIAFFDTAVYLLVILLFFCRRIPFAVRAYVFIYASYLLGLILLIVLGPSVAGPVWLFAFPVFAGVMMGFGASVVALAVNALTLLAIGILIWLEQPVWFRPEMHSVATWLVVSVNFIVLNTVAALSIGMILRGLQISLAEERETRKQLEQKTRERQKLQDQLQRAQKMEAIGTLAGGIAHDFNNMLAVIIGFTELALNETQAGTRQHNSLKHVLEAANRAADLVRQILAFSREGDTRAMPMRMAPIVKETLKLIRATLPSNIAIRERIETDAVIMGEPAHVHQILMNLAVNAEHAMAETGGALAIEISDRFIDSEASERPSDLKPGWYVCMAVSDTGYGIAPEHLQRIFDPFFTTKSPGEGTGMGLSVIHGIVKTYGGSIDVDSIPGRGATFHACLPAIGFSGQGGEAGEDERLLPRGKGRILLVDDEAAVSRMTEMSLQALGYQVTTIGSSPDALGEFKAAPDAYDLVITDMTMPHMSGEQLAQQIKSVRPDTPVILCTGFSRRMDPQKAAQHGIEALLMKPVARSDLAETVHRLLKGK